MLNPRDDVIARIFQAIRPLVLPKLREENERAKGKSKKPKGVKDVVIEGQSCICAWKAFTKNIALMVVSPADFEVSIFLTDQSTRHALLTKQKDFLDKKARIQSNSSKLTGWLEQGTNDNAIAVEDDVSDAPVAIRQESDESENNLEAFAEGAELGQNHKRRRQGGKNPIVVDDVISDDEGFVQTQRATTKKRANPEGELGGDEDEDGDKKKLRLNTAYDGFNIYGRVLCLIVKRRGNTTRAPISASGGGGQQMLESWVSTQAAQEAIVGED